MNYEEKMDLTIHVHEIATAEDQTEWVRWVDVVSLDLVEEMVRFWILMVVRAANAMTSTDYGDKLEEKTILGIRNMAFHTAHLSVTADHVTNAFRSITDDEAWKLRTQIIGVTAYGNEAVQDMLYTLCTLCLRALSSKWDYSGTMIQQRVVLYRTQAIEMRTKLREGDWCASCAEHVNEILFATNEGIGTTMAYVEGSDPGRGLSAKEDEIFTDIISRLYDDPEQ